MPAYDQYCDYVTEVVDMYRQDMQYSLRFT